MALRSNRDGNRRAAHGAVWAFLCCFTLGLGAGPVVFQLRNGDRIAGDILFEGTNTVVISTPWARELIIPLEHVESRLPLVAVTATNELISPTVAQTGPTDEELPALTPRPAKEWRAEAKVGLDLISGSRERQLYYGQFALTYARPQPAQTNKYFLNLLEYRVDYAETDGVESANRMFGGNKTDYDVGRDLFLYNFVGAGYDEVRKIESQFEIGPGMGWHLLTGTKFVANIEGGLTYQSQQRVDSPAIDSIFARVGEDFIWKPALRVTLTQRATWLIQTDEPERMQFRTEVNLALGIVNNLSFNLTAIELYDTRPVPGVTPSEFQLRSAIGMAF